MNNKIQIKRSDGNSLPTGLMAGELAWSDNNASAGGGGAAGYLWIGDAGTNIAQHKIGGPGWGLELLDSTTLTTGLSSPSLDANPAQFDRSLKIATTEYVDVAVENAEPAMDDISDAVMTGLADADMMIWDATATNPNGGTGMWKNRPISGHVSLASDGSTIVTNVQDGAVTLGTQTVGPYVRTMVAGDNIVIAGEGGEDASVTVSLAEHVVIAGNLTVSGATTTVESSTVSVTDPVFVIGGDAISDSTDRGIEFKWNDDDASANSGDGNTKTGFFGYDKTDGKFKYIMDASNSSETFSGVLGDAAFLNIEGKLVDSNQDNIAQVGTITNGAWQSVTKIGEAYGGTNIDTSNGNGNSDGVATVTAGGWSVEANLDVGYGGTGLSTLESNALMVGNGAGAVTMISTVGNNGKLLRVEAGVPTWSDTLDAGTW
tara:strand:+ start:4220 stop:5512 length:1293 start_codon:yes stop_codon:yes gene_type:complete